MKTSVEGSLLLTFRLDGNNFCVASEYIKAIIMPEKIEMLPQSPKTIAGITNYGKEQIIIIETRELFGKTGLKEYISGFGIMKQMHIDWIEALELYVKDGGTFSKTTNPHKCKFGLWYDTFTTENPRLKRLLRKIDAPHQRIHNCGAEIIELQANENVDKEKINELLAEARQICDDDIVPLLDRLIDVYYSANRGVLLVLQDNIGKAALLVDEVRELIPVTKDGHRELNHGISCSPYLQGYTLHENVLYLETNIEKVLTLIN